MELGLDQLAERSNEDHLAEIWEKSRSSWYRPQLPKPIIGRSRTDFPFKNYRITVGEDMIGRGDLYLENLFEHLIVHYIFCPRSLETAASLGLAALGGLKSKNIALARRMVNIFSDIVVDTFRLERSPEDEAKVILGWRRLSEEDLSPLDRVVLGFLREYWGVNLPSCDRDEVDTLLHAFSWGVRDKGRWPRQCQQTARILESLTPGHLGRGEIRTCEILRGDADSAPMAGLASHIEPGEYREVLALIGLNGDLKRWYRDQSYSIVIEASKNIRESWYPTGPMKWRFTDPPSELDIPYSMSLSPILLPGITTFKRDCESCGMMAGKERIPDLLLVIDSSRSMDGHRRGTKTHSATLAAFKAAQFAYHEGAMLAAINFSDKVMVQDWTRDLSAVEDVLVEYHGSRTHIPGEKILQFSEKRPGCLILCITDTHIQNLYFEWDYLKEASELCQFVLFCIDEANRDRYVEASLRDLGTVYYINKLEDLLSLVVRTAERAYDGRGREEDVDQVSTKDA